MNKIISPPNRVIYQKENWYVYFDPTSMMWVKVNEDGKKILSEFELDSDYAGAVEQLKQKYAADDATIEQFVIYMVEKAGYLHREEYHPRLITFPQKSIIPKTLYIHPSYRCNLKCAYCYNHKERHYYTEKKSYNELTVEDYRLLFQQAKQLGIKAVVYSGGEPLIREDIFEIASISKEMGFRTSIITNGTMITKEKAALLIRYFDRISVSIDSSIEAENDIMRGNGAHKGALRGIQYLRELNGAVSCLGVTRPENIDSVLTSWDYFVNQLGCLSFNSQAYIPMEEAKQNLPAVNEFVIKYGQIRNQLNYRNGNKSATGLSNHCGICSGEIAIGADGNVFPCQSLLNEEFCGGNIKTDSLKNILENSPIFKRLREFTVDQLEGCQACAIKYLCGGGCRASHLRITGDFLENNQYYCAINKEITVNGMFEMSIVPNVPLEQEGGDVQC